jgi:hypothetical protein
MSRFAFSNLLNNRRFTITGGGVSFNAGIEVALYLTLFRDSRYTNSRVNLSSGSSGSHHSQHRGGVSVAHRIHMDDLEYAVTLKWQSWAY